MKLLLMNIFFVLLCSNLAASDRLATYVAGVVIDTDPRTHAQWINEAAKSNVDILLLFSPESTAQHYNFDEAVKSVSKAAKEAQIYVVANLYEVSSCNEREMIRSDLVFDRQGAIAAIARNSINSINCNLTSSAATSFTTDFGVTFDLISDEDIVLQNYQHFKGVKNFVLADSCSMDLPVFSAPQFISSWAYIHKVNIISNTGIFAGKAGLHEGAESISIAELSKDGRSETETLPISNSETYNSNEDLSSFTIKEISEDISDSGYEDTLCHDGFCCDFFLKTTAGSNTDFKLAVYNGLRSFNDKLHHIGVQNCAIITNPGSNTNSDVTFENISVGANFTTHNTAQYPVIIAREATQAKRFVFKKELGKNTHRLTIEIANAKNVVNFGIFGRDFSKDFADEVRNSTSKYYVEQTCDLYDYIFNDNIQEFFDYLWIRLRVLIFIVSIYVLEMM